ncbi:FIST signal transduction protein [Dankookia sp. GCM10030260]
MRCEEKVWTPATGWRGGEPIGPAAGLVLYFGARDALADGARHRELRAAYPGALVLGCSTGGQIRGEEVEDDGVAALAMAFRATGLRLAVEPGCVPAQSRRCGASLGRALAAPDLAGVFVLADGLRVNGSALVEGLVAALGPQVPVTGGLAGDGPHFRATLVGAGDHPPQEGLVATIGLYGDALRLAHGSAGGWEAFGPVRRVTRSAGNILRELDGAPALDLYERYLGEEAAGLPGTGLFYPLRVWHPDQPDHDVVRTLLAIDRTARSMTFAGDVPEGWAAQLMRGGAERLTAGAAEAAARAAGGVRAPGDSVALLVSCIGRRLLLGQATHEEIEAVAGRLPPGVRRLGFYSYGEIAPHPASGTAELHNQTMTITLLSETA